MAGELTHIVKTGFSQTNSIYYGSSSIASVYYGSNLIWKKSAVSYSIVNPSNGAAVVKYVPTSNMTLESFYMYQPLSSIGFNYAAGVWNANGTNLSRITATTNLVIDTNTYITVSSVNYYKSTQSYNGTGPSLTAGTTYYLFLGQQFSGNGTRVTISGDTSGSYVNAMDWELNAGQTIRTVDALVTGVTVVMGVTAL